VTESCMHDVSSSTCCLGMLYKPLQRDIYTQQCKHFTFYRMLLHNKNCCCCCYNYCFRCFV